MIIVSNDHVFRFFILGCSMPNLEVFLKTLYGKLIVQEMAGNVSNIKSSRHLSLLINGGAGVMVVHGEGKCQLEKLLAYEVYRQWS